MSVVISDPDNSATADEKFHLYPGQGSGPIATKLPGCSRSTNSAAISIRRDDWPADAKYVVRQIGTIFVFDHWAPQLWQQLEAEYTNPPARQYDFDAGSGAGRWAKPQGTFNSVVPESSGLPRMTAEIGWDTSASNASPTFSDAVEPGVISLHAPARWAL